MIERISEIGTGQTLGYVERGYVCFCGAWVPDGTTHVCLKSNFTPVVVPKQGWECPKCHSIWSPEVKGCQKCNS